MKIPFDVTDRLIRLPVYLRGPRGEHRFQFALDTAATRSAASGLVLELLGYHQSQAVGQHQVRAGSGGVRVGLLSVARLTAFGRTELNFPLQWLPLPPATMLDGLLGLDFFRGHVLEIDFVRGYVELDPERKPWWRFWR